MNSVKYEHHSPRIFISELCPFKIKSHYATNNRAANWHKNPEIIFITGGSGYVQCGSSSYSAKNGDIFVINPETIHRVYSTEGVRYSFIIIDDMFCRENGIIPENYRFVDYFSDSDTERIIQKILETVTDEKAKSSGVYDAKLRSAVLELLTDICEKHSEYIPDVKNQKEQGSDQYARKALMYISENYRSRITIEQIASCLGITKYHLAREFKKYTGETVILHLNKVRCINAQQLIRSGYSVTQAALESGFESGSYFSQIYRRIFGAAPSDCKSNAGRGVSYDLNDPFGEQEIDS